MPEFAADSLQELQKQQTATGEGLGAGARARDLKQGSIDERQG